VSFRRGSAVWARRGALVAILAGAALVPGRAGSTPASKCRGPRCQDQVAAIVWAKGLPGSWTAENGSLGTVASQGQAYAAVGSGLAVVGDGTSVVTYQLSTGQLLWTASLADFPLGSAVISVRAWSGVVTAGVSVPATSGPARRVEVVLAAADGRRLQAFAAAPGGGAVEADQGRTVIVGTGAVTCYANATGRVLWRRPTGPVAQAWRVDDGSLLMTVAKGGFLGAAPVTALRRIDLRTGAEAIVRPAGRSFAGTLSGAVSGVVLFSGPAGLSAYSQADGRPLWTRPDAVPEVVDAVKHVLYVVSGSSLTGLDPLTGKVVTSAATPGAVALYAVSNGVAFGLDEGAQGDAWGYDLARKRVIWTTRAMPWPHYFVDLSGLGGSADPTGGTVVLASCAQVGVTPAGGTPPPCVRPQLVAISLVQADRESRPRLAASHVRPGRPRPLA
jgi:outer membrane protein assembly factor BamB